MNYQEALEIVRKYEEAKRMVNDYTQGYQFGTYKEISVPGWMVGKNNNDEIKVKVSTTAQTQPADESIKLPFPQDFEEEKMWAESILHARQVNMWSNLMYKIGKSIEDKNKKEEDKNGR